MIISADKTKVFFAITKNGSTTMEFLLSQIPGTISLNDIRHRYGNRGRLVYAAQDDNSPVADVNAMEIQGYGFLRNPYDRFFSACNHLKRSPHALVNLFPEKFSESDFPIPTDQYDRRWTLEEWTSMPLIVRLRIRGLSAEDFLNIPQEKLGLVMRQQSHWLKTPNTEILKYSDFQNEARRLITLFGGDPTVNIPNLNAADDFPTATDYGKNLEYYMEIFARYREDFELFDLYDGSDHI